MYGFGAFFIIFLRKVVNGMEFMAGIRRHEMTGAELMGGGWNNQTVTLHGAVHALRRLGGLTFLTLRLADGVAQCVFAGQADLDGVTGECAVAVTGAVRAEPRAPGGGWTPTTSPPT